MLAAKNLIRLVLLLLGLTILQAAYADLSVTITSPVDGAQFNPCGDILFTVDAQNTDGEIKYVYFYVNDVRKRRDTRAPWEWEWKSVNVGEYVVHAVIEDAEGNQSNSAPITITVGEPTPGNILVNGNFECGLAPWQVELFDVAEAEAEIYNDGWFDDSTYAYITIANQGEQPWSVQFSQTIGIEKGHVYEILFLADAPQEKDITLLLQATTAPYPELFNEGVTIDQYNEYGPYIYESDTTLPQLKFKFILSSNTREVIFDDVRMIDITALQAAVDGTPPDVLSGKVNGFTLSQNYPNPFNPETTIRYTLSSAQDVNLSVYDPSGRTVKTLYSGVSAPGAYHVQWDGRGLYLSFADTGHDSG